MRHEANFGTGDINLAAACMAMGVPLKPFRPVVVVKRDNGRDYGRFNLEPLSVCGRFSVLRLDKMFGGDAPTNPGEENFAAILAFVKARPSGVRTLDDWYGFACEWLRDQGETVIPARGAVEDFIKGAPNSMPAHIFAFILNRAHAFDLAKAACGRPQIMASRGKAHVLLDERLPRRVKADIYSRL